MCRQCITKQIHHFADSGPYSQSYDFSSSYVEMWELDHKENWALKNWCFWTVVLEETLESPLDSREIRSVDPKGSKSWIFIGRNWCWSWSSNTWPPDAKSRLIGKDPDAGENWGQEKKGATEDELVGWHHRLWGRWWRTGKPGVLQSIASQSWALLNDWTTTICVQMKGMKVGLQRKGCGKEDTPPQVPRLEHSEWSGATLSEG